MVQNWRLLAALLSLPILSLCAGEVSIESNLQEIALEETAYNSKLGQKCENRGARRTQAEKPVPEEEAIRSQPVITPQVAPHIVDGTDTFITADFIWWRTNIEAMEYAYGGVSNNGTLVTAGTSTAQQSAQNPDFQYDPGVKVGLGWHFDHDGWDMTAGWTYLASGTQGNSTSAFAGSGAGMTTVQPVALTDGTNVPMNVTTAASKWKQDFNVIDLELGRDFFLSRYLTMRPHLGFKTAWIHETTTNTFTPVAGTVDSTVDNFVTGASLYNNEHMWGLGIRTGFDTGWHISKNWMIYGDLAFTNLWGRFTKAGTTSLTETVGARTTMDTVQTYYTVLPVIEAGIGLSYICWFSKNHYRFETRLGWEEQVWINYNRSQDYTRVGNLSVQGLTLKTMLNF